MGLARTIFYCLRLRHNEKLSASRVQEVQLQNLREAVRFAKARSPFYADLYREIDPDAPDFSVQSLPPVNKEILMENFDRVVTDPRLKFAEVMDWVRDRERIGTWFMKQYVVTHTSGTTGTPGYFVYSRREWDWIQALAVTRGVRFKPTFFGFFADAFRILVKKIQVALVSVLNGHFVTYVLFLLTPRIGKLVSKFHYLSVVDPLSQLVTQLNEIHPNVVHCYPTMLEVLAYEQMEGRLHIKPWIFSCSSEPLTPSARRVIEGAFPDSPIFETYGTSEGVTIASECRFHRGLHLNSDYYIVESVRDDGTEAGSGWPGDRVYLSCLFAHTMPILRYEISDVSIPLAEPCPCGLPFPMIKVRGRTDDTFWIYDAQKNPVALPPIPFEAVFLDIEGLSQYQLVQEERDRLRVIFRPRSGADIPAVAKEIRARLEHYLEQKGLKGCLKLTVESVAEIARHPTSGKIRQIYSKVERLYLPGKPLGDRRAGDDRRLLGAMEPVDDRRQHARRADDKKPEQEP